MPPSGDSGYEEVISLIADAAGFNRDVADIYNTFKRNADSITRELQVSTDQGIKFYANMAKAAASAVQTMYGDVLSTKESLNRSLQEIAEKEDAVRKQQYKDEAARLRQSVAEKVQAIESSEARIRSINKAVTADIIANDREEARVETAAREAAVKKAVSLVNERRNAEARAHQQQMREVQEFISSEQRAATAAKNAAEAQAIAREKQWAAIGQGTGGSTGGNRANALAQVAMRTNIPGASTLADMSYAASNADKAFGGLSVSAMGAVAAIGAVIAVTSAAASSGMKLQESLHSMATLMEGAGQNTAKFQANLEMLTTQAGELSVKFNKDINEVVMGFKEALSAGIDEKDIKKFADVAGTLSNAIGSNLQATTNVLTTFKDAYGLSIDELTGVSNQLFRAIDVGKISVEQLNSNIGKLIPTAASAGISITDMLSGVSSLSRIMPTNQAITALNKLIEDIVAPSEKAAKAFKELGIETGQNQFQLKGLVGVISEIEAKAGGKLDVLAEIFPEQRALKAAGGLSKILELLKEQNIEIGKAVNSTAAFDAAVVATNTLGQNMGRIWKTVWNEVTIGFEHAAEKINSWINTPAILRFLDHKMGTPWEGEIQGKYGPPIVLGGDKKFDAPQEAGDPTAAKGIDFIDASVQALNADLKQGSDLAFTFGEKLKDVSKEDKWRVAVLANFDSMIDQIVKRMEANRDRIVAGYKALFGTSGINAEDLAKMASDQVEDANSNDNALLRQLLNERKQTFSEAKTGEASPASEVIKKYTDMGEKVWEGIMKAGKKIEAEKAKIAQEAFSEFDKLYKKDTELYEAAEKKKAAIQEKYSEKIKKIEEDRISAVNKLNDLNKSWELDQHKGDPSAIARMARRQREGSTDELRNYVNNGGSDERRINMLRDDIIKALSMEHDNSDNARSPKWMAIENELEALLNKAFGNTTKATKAKEAKELASANYNRMSPEEMAKAAASKANSKQMDKAEITQNLAINLTVTANGLVDEKGLNFLKNEMIKRIANAQKQNTDNTNIPRSRYPDRSTSDAE